MAIDIQKQKYTKKKEPTPFHCYDVWNRQLECYKTLFAFVQLNPLFLSLVKQTNKKTNKQKKKLLFLMKREGKESDINILHAKWSEGKAKNCLSQG